jgi:hypothetical protein
MSKTESAKFTASVKAATKYRLEKLAKISGRSISFLALVKAGGGEERNVTRHSVRSSSRSSDRTRSIPVSAA